MARSDYPIIAREGWFYLLAVLALLVISARLELIWAIVPLTLLLLFLVLLFRDPTRRVPAVPLGVVSPADGVVVSVTDTPTGILQREAKRIIIRVSSLGAYSARSPIGGVVMDLRDQGQLGVRLRGQGGLWVRTEGEEDVVLVFTGSRLIGRPKAMVGYGERLGQGQRVAYLRLPDFAQVYLPQRAVAKVKPGDSVLAGRDILAELPLRQTENGS